MDYDTANDLIGQLTDRLSDIASAITAADRGRNDALSTVGSILSRLTKIENDSAEAGKAIQAQDVEIQGLTNRLADLQGTNATAWQELTNRLEANEQGVQSCLSTLGELNKMVRTIAGKLPPDRLHIEFPKPIP